MLRIYMITLHIHHALSRLIKLILRPWPQIES